MKNVFSYYNLKGRLIRVKEMDLSHFKDITPHSVHKLDEKTLKASYIAWRDADGDNGTWQHIATYDFFADNDECIDMVKNFKGLADYRKPKKVQTVVTDEMIDDMKRRFAEGEKMYQIAAMFGIHHSTVKKYVCEV